MVESCDFSRWKNSRPSVAITQDRGPQPLSRWDGIGPHRLLRTRGPS
ncbi:hypothetical protein ACFFX0_03015 [Citricoccus parietis]|uniref:Uncharacterized protein n=1 Tax=Citricoccus parietis TaxID=592307 RepID=A0ABV5FU74_9MICC